MSKHIEEAIIPGLKSVYQLKNILGTAQSEFQTVDLVDTVPFGRALLLDGLMQSADVDEFMYHEALVHPALLMHPNPKRVFIGGGGEGSTAREVLRHKSVTECVMADIDAVCVNFCKEFLPQNKEAFADPRLTLKIDDCKAVIEGEADGSFDVIILDLDDPLPGGPCFDLYTQEFYAMCATKLSENGIFITQTSAGGVSSYKLVFSPVTKTLGTIFPNVKPYLQHILSFGDMWSWSMGLKNKDAAIPSAETIDALIEERITGGSSVLNFLDGQTFQAIFVLPKFMRHYLPTETRLLTKANPALFSIGQDGSNTAALSH